MKTTFKLLWVCIACLACESNRANKLSSGSTGEIEPLSRTIIDESIIPFSRLYEPKIYHDTLLAFVDGARMGVHFFDARSGELLKSFEKSSLGPAILPDYPIGNFDFADGKVYLFYHGVEKVHVFDWNQKELDNFRLKYSRANHKSESDGIFQIAENRIVVGSGYNGRLREFFKNSHLVTIFDEEGRAMVDFGAFPPSYLQGNLVPSKTENIALGDDSVYILNVLGEPQLRKFDFGGKLIEAFTFDFAHFNPKINFFDQDPFESDFNDQIIGISLSNERGKTVVYTTVVHFEDHSWQTGLESYSWYLVRIDIESGTTLEYRLNGNEVVGHPHLLVRNMGGNTLATISRENDSEALVLKSYRYHK
jgi:hypothetical protein